MKLAKSLIQYVGLTKLSPNNQMALKNFSEKAMPKITRMIKGTCSLKVYVKTHENDGKRKKYSITASTIHPGKTYSAKGFSYKFNDAVLDALSSLEMEVKKAKHADEQKKGREIIRRKKRYTKSSNKKK